MNELNIWTEKLRIKAV